MKLNEHPRLLLAAILSALVVLVLWTSFMTPQHQLPLVSWFGETMGTTYEIKLVGMELDDNALDALTREVDAELVAVNAAMSTYIPDSEISQFNRGAFVEEAFLISDRFQEVMSDSFKVYASSGGAFDPTLGPLIDLWGFGAGSTEDSPITENEVAERLKLVGLEKITFTDGALRKQQSAMEINLSAIAKGYAVDRLHQLLQEKGYANIYVEIGGEVVCQGVNDSGNPWRIGIQLPERDASASVLRVIRLKDRALATSGDYRNFLEDAERNRHHILDPRTGFPADHRLTSVSVLAEDCMTADAVATALYVMGTEEGMEWLQDNPDIEALFIDRHDGGFHFTATDGFEDALIAVP